MDYSTPGRDAGAPSGADIAMHVALVCHEIEEAGFRARVLDPHRGRILVTRTARAVHLDEVRQALEDLHDTGLVRLTPHGFGVLVSVIAG